MRIELLFNLILLVVFSAIGLAALIAAIFLGAYWHFFFAALCAVCVHALWNDECGGESVKSHAKKKITASKRDK